MSNTMDKAKDAVSGFLGHHNKHTVDIEQTHAPAVTHERVQQAEHENVTVAHDREIHQHHHQTHVQPIQDKVVEPEQHHHKVAAVEERHHHHGKDAEVERTLQEQAAQFRDTTEALPTQHSQSHNTVVGEHVHHHIHDTIQPVIERERVQQHVVHTTVPIHERIDKEPVIHSGNVLPTKTLAEFQAAGHSLTGAKTTGEHIDYEGDPLKIRDDSRVGFDHHHRHQGTGTTGAPGEFGTAAGAAGTAGILGGHHHQHNTQGPHTSNVENKLDPRVDSDGDGRSGLGNTTGTGTLGNTTGTGFGNTTGTGLGHTTGTGVGHTTGTGTSGVTGTGTSSHLGTTEGYGTTVNTGLGSGRTGVTEDAAHNTTGEPLEKQSTLSKLASKVGL